jgi:hypothetical protein
MPTRTPEGKKRAQRRVNIRKRTRNKQARIDFLEPGCQICKQEATHSHHVDERTKDFDTGTENNMSHGRFVAELAKCIPLCEMHHREIHKKGLGGNERYTQADIDHDPAQCYDCNRAG